VSHARLRRTIRRCTALLLVALGLLLAAAGSLLQEVSGYDAGGGSVGLGYVLVAGAGLYLLGSAFAGAVDDGEARASAAARDESSPSE
jgi:hypothetical protein